MKKAWWRDPLLISLVAGAAALYATLSLARHATFRSTGFDLGLFDQVVWHLSNIDTPASSLKGLESIFGDHLSPILVLLAPIRAVWPSPQALLVVQACLLAASAVPLYLFASERLKRTSSLLITLAYLLFGGLQAGVWFDVHEVAFAPLGIGLMLLAADRERPATALAWAVVLLLIKEDMGFVVAAFGVYLALSGWRWHGLAAIVGGVGWYLVATGLLIPAAAGGVSYQYWSYGQLGRDLPDALKAIAQAPWRLVEVAVQPFEKVRTLAYLFGAWLGLGLVSPITLVAVPLLAERMLSENPQYWTLQGHYSMAIAPVLAFGAVDGLARLSGWTKGRVSPHRSQFVAAAGMSTLAVLLTAAFPLHRLFTPNLYRTPTEYRSASAAIARIPGSASLAASNRLVAHLADRNQIVLLGPSPPRTEYVIAAVNDPDPAAVFPNPDLASVRRLVQAARRTYVTVFDRQGIIVLRRRESARGAGSTQGAS